MSTPASLPANFSENAYASISELVRTRSAVLQSDCDRRGDDIGPDPVVPVKPGDTILNAVPLSATPEVEAQVLNKDIGFVLVGQKVSVKFDAFPFTRYGTVSGEVVDISRDANKDDTCMPPKSSSS